MVEKEKAQFVLSLAKDLIITGMVKIPDPNAFAMTSNSPVRKESTKEQDSFETIVSKLIAFLSKQYDIAGKINQSPVEPDKDNADRRS
ncbi:MAG: hypothetical protein SFH39_00925 [Candidatus Magnetobacterium sp. LHC-1]|nr:hypothetical protein [Nitrospirota bacterium]